jgi:O-6-methylguanine DNA methyltransferase
MIRAPMQMVEIQTTWGPILISLLNGKVMKCTLPYLDKTPAAPFSIISAGDDPISKFIETVFEGIKSPVPAWGDLPGTAFQHRVWKAISTISLGQTRTYGQLARTIGRPSACRAVANACGRNPIPLFIPCHRVVGANQQLGGFSSGKPWKHLILSRENDAPF